jgi:pimeloyl-ACP methyl ester carboxylesterase
MRPTRIELPNVSLSALTWGPESGRLAVLLHGFPDTAHTWRHLGPALADAGWRVVAPFTRGYAPSGVPADGSGHIAALMADAVGVHEAMGGRADAVLVGHDWGAITANALGAHDDSPFSRVVAMSVPPFPAVRSTRALRVLPRQLRNSWYIGFNQLPWLPERQLDRLARKLWRDWSPGYDATEDLLHVAAALPDRAHRKAAIGNYRSLASPFPPPRQYRRWKGAEMRLPVVPTLYLHGADDGCLDPRLAALVGPHLPPGSDVGVIAGAGHFLQLEQPGDVNSRVLAFLSCGVCRPTRRVRAPYGHRRAGRNDRAVRALRGRHGGGCVPRPPTGARDRARRPADACRSARAGPGAGVAPRAQGGQMVGLLIVTLLLILAVGWVGVRVLRDQMRERNQVDLELHDAHMPTLEYVVPNGQDPAVLLAALELAGYTATVDSQQQPYQVVMIACPDGVDRQRAHVRSVIDSASVTTPEDGVPLQVDVRFRDEA